MTAGQVRPCGSYRVLPITKGPDGYTATCRGCGWSATCRYKYQASDAFTAHHLATALPNPSHAELMNVLRSEQQAAVHAAEVAALDAATTPARESTATARKKT